MTDTIEWTGADRDGIRRGGRETCPPADLRQRVETLYDAGYQQFTAIRGTETVARITAAAPTGHVERTWWAEGAGPAIWGARAEHLAEKALGELRDGADAIPTLDAAIAALRIEAGELPASALEDYPFPGEPEPEGTCICPPELLGRGGYRGGCPVHSYS